jgi:hypothetical protein
MTQTTLLYISRLTFTLSTDFSHLLKQQSNTGNDLTGLCEIDAKQEIQSRPFFTEFLEERGELRTAEFIEMHQLLAIEAHLRWPVLNERIGLCIRVEIVTELFDDGRLA